MTYGEMIEAAIACKTEDEAYGLVAAWVELLWASSPERPPSELAMIVLENIGYATGYMDREDGDRVLRLFHTVHPIFGTDRPTPEEAMALGIKWAQASPAEREAMKRRPGAASRD